MRYRLQKLVANWLSRQIEHDFGPRCEKYDLDDFPEELKDYQPRHGLNTRCPACWGHDLADNLNEFAR